MPFCTNCGNEMNDIAKFCDKCGTQVIKKQEPKTEEKATNTRKVKKCPACGEIIPTYTVICPSCGYEINAEEVSEGFSDFLNQVNALERAIVNSQPNNTFFKMYSTGKKIAWIALNVFLLCIPLLVKLVINLLNTNNTPKLTTEEQQLATFVENYSFPNNREVILEALVFTKEKVDFVSREKASRKTTYWMRLWYSKAEQLKDKADILFPNDTIVERSFQEIVKDKKKIQKSALLKTIGGIVLLIILIFIFIGIIASGSSQIQWRQTGMFEHLPDPQDHYGEIIEETNDSLVIELTNISQEELEAFLNGCKDKGFTTDVVDDNDFYYAENDSGYRLILFYDSDDLTLNINLKAINENNGEG